MENAVYDRYSDDRSLKVMTFGRKKTYEKRKAVLECFRKNFDI